MKDLFEILRAPMVIGAFILAVLIVVGSYTGSEWYYGDVEPIEVLEISAPTLPLSQNVIPAEVDPDLIGGESLPTHTESKPTVPPVVESESIDDFLAELSGEEKALLIEKVVDDLPLRESIFGLGPYPEVPSDYPNQNIWEDLENLYETGHATVEHELLHRVLIKLWNQGEKVDSSFMSSKNGRVYPLYNDTVYVRYLEDENEDGSIERYVSSFTAHSSLQSYQEEVREGIQPSWIKVIHYEDGGIEPYSFLGLD